MKILSYTGSKLTFDMKPDPILNIILFRIKNKWNNCSWVERNLKEIRCKLTVEKGVICNVDVVVLPATQRSKIIRSIHDDVHWNNVYAKEIKASVMVARLYYGCIRIHKKL